MARADEEETTDDADVEDKTSDEEEEDEDEDDESEEESEDDESDEDDDEDKNPLTKVQVQKMISDARNADRRRASKGKDGKPLPKPAVRTARPDTRVDALEKTIADVRLSETKRQFGYENDLSPKEVDLVFRLYKRPTPKVLKDPIVKGAIDGLRAQKNAKENIPSTSGRTFAVSGKKFTDLKPEDKQANFVARRQAELSRQGKA